MENELRNIKNVLWVIVFALGFQALLVTCNISSLDSHVSRVADKMPDESLKNINTTLDYRLLKLQERCSK